jgi:hypothetical protein
LTGRVLLVSTLFFMVASLPAGGEEKSKKDQVLELLTGYEHVPGKDDWDQIGQDAEAILIEIVNDSQLLKIIRARAIFALRYFPDETCRKFLLAFVFMDKQDEMFVRKGLYSLSHAFGKGVLGDISLFLGHENPDVREASVRAMGKIVCRKSLKLLKKQLKIEKNEMVREVLKKEIEHLKSLMKKGKQ